MQDEKVFLDTNVIIYAYDTSAGTKHEIARKVMVDLWDSGAGVISTQVLQEFFVGATKRLSKPLNERTATEIISDLLKWNIVINDGESILSAIDIHQHHKYSFWDSLIIDAAVKGGAEILLSEDLSDGQVIKGIRIKNPFI